MPGISNTTLNTNVFRSIEDVAALIGHAKQVSGRARSGYYRTGFLLIASIVEAVLYHFIELEIASNPSICSLVKNEKIKKINILNSKMIGTSKEVWVVESLKINYDHRKSTFNEMIGFCRDTRLLSEYYCDRLDYVRNKRNEIHLQTLNTTSWQYNISMLERAAKVADMIYAKL